MDLLDTNVVSELRKGDRADPQVLSWAHSASPELAHVSAITIMEIELGILRMERRDARQGRVLRDWMSNALLPAFEGRVLPVTEEVARTAAGLSVPDMRPMADALIAATALVAGATLVTRNTQDYAGVGVTIVNPWT